MECTDCFTPLPSKNYHGNTKRCEECALTFKRESNRNRQFIIRIHGNSGYKNYALLNNIFHPKYSKYLTRRELERNGFNFIMGFTVIDSPDDDANYVRTIQIMEYTLKFNPKDPDEVIFITKS